MTRFFKSLTVREMTLWTVAFAVGLIAGYLGFVMGAYIIAACGAMFLTLRYIVPGEEERRKDGLSQEGKTDSSAQS